MSLVVSGAGRALVLAALVSLFLHPSLSAAEQAAGSLAGRVTRETGDIMAGALVSIDELRRDVRTDADGRYRFDSVPPGTYHLSVRAEGYSSRRTEVSITSEAVTLDLALELDLHFAEVVSVSPSPRAQFESYQPTSVLAGQELQQELEGTVGETLQYEPGVAMRSLGPGPSRPVIRGLDGDRVVVLEDGQRVGDLSSQSADHGVTVNPASAQRIEVVRGPATLLYGANAIGGLVNVVTDKIPTAPMQGARGNLTATFGSSAGEALGAGDVHLGNGRWVAHLGGGASRRGNFSTPEGEVANSQSRSGFFSGGGAWTSDRIFAGASYAFDDTEYGVPVVEEGNISLTPRRHAFTARSGGTGLNGPVTSYRATLGVRSYEHSEIDAGEIGTTFENDTREGELLLSHRPLGRFSGTVGTWLLNRDFASVGEEALSPPIDQNGAALFLYEEVTWPHVTLQFGGRFDHTSFSPEGGLPSRDFNEVSASAGLLIRPAPADDRLVFAISVARAARNPALEELYFYGPHPGNLAFEVGNPSLGAERAFGIDLSVRARTERFRGEVSVFRNAIDDFIFRNPIDEGEFDAREEEFDERFNVSHGGDEGEDAHADEFPFVEFVGADSVLWGFEAHGDVEVVPGLFAEATVDLVRGELTDSGDPLPRMPPFRLTTGGRWQRNALQAGGSVTFAGDQTRVFGAETPTAGYGMLRLFTSYSFGTGAATHTVTARLDNATNETYRNHLNYLKDVLPEIGRNFKLVFSTSF